MANDKDFIVKNAVEVGGSTKTTLGTVTNNNVDLSTGNYFADTPSGNSTYTFSNAGDNQSFQIEVTGGLEEIESNFSTTTYGGTGSAQTITTGIDLSGSNDGLVWVKWRSGALGSAPHVLVDTVRGVNKNLKTNTTDSEDTTSSIDSFTSTGFTLAASNGPQGGTNYSGGQYAAWTFKKAAKFFDVVTYTGDGASSRQIAHNLGTTVGSIFVKATNVSGTWEVYHRGLNGGTDPEDYKIALNTDAAQVGVTGAWANTAPTDSVFYVNGTANTNDSGKSYVAYLFAHDTSSGGQVKCDSYSGTGSAGNTVNIGWEPQWLLIKRTDTSIADSWIIHDNVRGMSTGNDPYLLASSSAGENSIGIIQTNSTGFELTSTYGGWNASGGTYIYIAIRKGSALDLTWPSSIEWAGGVAPDAPATGETDLFNISTDDGGTTYQGFKVADNLS